MLIHHVCIQTNSYELSKVFYCDLLGFQLISETANFHGRGYNSWLREPGGFMIELQTAKAGGQFSPACKESEGLAHLCFLVEAVTIATFPFNILFTSFLKFFLFCRFGY